MTTTRWTLTINNQTHTVRLEHGYWSGKRDIYVDDRLVEHSRKLFDSGSIHNLLIDQQPLHLFITTNGVTFNYLLINGLEIIPSDRNLRAGQTAEKLLHSKHFWDLLIWRELCKRLDLPYSVDANMPWHIRHRLVGVSSGYLIKIMPGYLQQSLQEGFAIIIRYAPIALPEQLERLAKDERILPLLGRLRTQVKEIFGVQSNHAYIFLPFEKKETPADIAEKVRQFIAVISSYAPRLEKERCETPDCRSRGKSPVRLALINNVPYFVCDDCLDRLPQQAKQDEEAFRRAPSNLLPGLLAGIIATIVGAVIMASVSLFLTPSAGLLFSLITMPGMIYLMSKVKVKPSWSMLFMSAGLAILSILLGYLVMTFLVLIRSGYPIAVNTLIQSGQDLLQDPGMKINLLLTGFVITLYFFGKWAAMKINLGAGFNPQVEIISSEPSVQAVVK